MITYEFCHGGQPRHITVFLDGKPVGHIEQLFDGMWQYWPKGPRAEGGDKFPTLALCKRSLEAE
jgi:hypothetical protein